MGSIIGRPEIGSGTTRLSRPKTARTVPSVSTSAGVPAPQVMATLPVLELAGLARKEGAVWRRL